MTEQQYSDLLVNGALEIVDYYVSDDLWISLPDRMIFMDFDVSEFEKYLFVCQRVGNLACTHVFIYTYTKIKNRGDINGRKETFKSFITNRINSRC